MMNLLSYFTKLNKKLQAISQTWEKEILPRLPQNLELLAQTSGVLQRKRGISSATQLLKVFFLYAVSGLYFRMLAAAAFGLGISIVSDTAWRKKYQKAVPFLQEVLQEMLSSLFPSASLPEKQRQGLLIDGSLIRQQGKKQYQQRIHTCYSLNQNRIQQVCVTDYHTAESFDMFSFQKEETVFYGNYVILMTSLGVEYDREEILSIYRSRWQIELLFKRFKQNLKITTLQQGSEAYAEATVLLWMLVWLITEKQVFLTKQFLEKKEEEQKQIVYLNWEICQVAFCQIKEILCMSWSLFVDVKNKAFSRYFLPQKRHRHNQNQVFPIEILPGFIA